MAAVPQVAGRSQVGVVPSQVQRTRLRRRMRPLRLAAMLEAGEEQVVEHLLLQNQP